MTTTIIYHERIEESRQSETGFRYRHYETVPTREEEISGETESDLFIQFYKLNNRLRYCNGFYYKWKDSEMKTKYAEWLESDDYKKISFELFYGNGVVD